MAFPEPAGLSARRRDCVRIGPQLGCDSDAFVPRLAGRGKQLAGGGRTWREEVRGRTRREPSPPPAAVVRPHWPIESWPFPLRFYIPAPTVANASSLPLLPRPTTLSLSFSLFLSLSRSLSLSLSRSLPLSLSLSLSPPSR